MNKKILGSILLIGSLSVSHLAMAASLQNNMISIATAYSDFSKSSNVKDAETALNKMKLAAIDSQKSKPSKLANKPDNSAEVMDYHKGLDQLVAEIDKTNLLVKAGKLDQAKVEGKTLLDIRNVNHKKFK
ncbi:MULTISPECIES: cytochrome b562 [Acinetobacter]|uniref:Soluble cytochrome b562 n=2 Tax=Acinetobacter baylyi TaxID=202950 RepID=A0ABU0UVU7_ACIBI|nr:MULTISPECIES: cytochrome b562 [Acinetobacter]ENV54853.1 hypothetical protein F952_00935 [Acinetobacter baylyi DSM 14961 = CIP 107474]KAF2370157.1 ATP-binding protein [Acinetobacter baylyi]KAF2371272.1 ATP-binding protein [Acinetobacter baylyi]KAF2376220.1 ATP-binding protein [Acinetobacter baylyi]KAF2379676.1 ATP-binding protein [Acinetobacter baylyi]